MNKHLKNIALIFIISVFITFVFDFFYGGISSNFTSLALNILYGLIIGTSIAMSGFLAQYIIGKNDIQKQPIKTYTLLIISVFLYITIDVFVVNALWYHLTQAYPLTAIFTNSGALISSLLTIFIGIIIFFILLSKKFITKFIEAEKEIQKAKDESAKFQYETLKNQINPHFLFNSLNVLSSLMYKDVEKADEFTIKLSNIYRYILDYQDEDLVKLESEIEFIEKYTYLLSIRFDQNFELKIDNWEKYKERYVVPMALQLVIENVFKHNVVSKEQPMQVKVSFKEEQIIISNLIQLKKNKAISHGLGLKNIEKRYELLSERKCNFTKTDSEFTVQIPLLQVQSKNN